MDLFAPIANISLEQYAELCARTAECAEAGNAEKVSAVLAELSVRSEDWEAAQQGFRARMEDMGNHGAVAARFVPLYQAALGRVLGGVLVLSFEDYVALSAEALLEGLSAMLKRRGLSAARYSQLVYYWNSTMVRESQRLQSYSMMVDQEWQRLSRGGAPREIKFESTQAAVPPQPSNAAGADFDKKAEQAAHAVGSAFVAGVSALGSALDSFGKSMTKPKIGSHVKVAWSDGNYYPGTVVQVGQGQFLVAMSDGKQHWVPESYVKPV